MHLPSVGCAKSEPLTADFMDAFSAMYVIRDSKKMGEKDFVPEINENVLEILEHESRKMVKFDDENLFLIMDGILYENRNDKFSMKVM